MKAIAYRSRCTVKLLFFLLLVAIVVSACTPTVPPPPLTRVTVQFLWTHTNTFAGYYAADQNGYYAAEGLAVTFLQGGPKVDYLTPVVNGAAQFGDGGSDELILARAAGKPLLAIATTYRRSPVVFFTLAGSGITRPQDFAGKKIRVAPGLSPALRAMTARVGVSPDQYVEIVTPSDVALFAAGQPPVWGGYLNFIVAEAEHAGHKLNIIYPDDYGVHFYGDSIFARDDFIAANPDLVRRFLRATLKGWQYAVEHPTAVGELVRKYKSDADAALEVVKMTSSLMLVNTGEDYIGWMKLEVWAGMEKTLREQGVLTKPLDVTQVYTMQFLKEIYVK